MNFKMLLEAIFTDVSGCKDLDKTLLKSTEETAYPSTFTNWICLSVISEDRGKRIIRNVSTLISQYSATHHISSLKDT
jgi:hypothetical protein